MKAPAASRLAPPLSAPPRQRRGQYAAVLVIALTIAVFAPTISHEFVDLDDPTNITFNPRVNNASWTSFRQILMEDAYGQYIPLTYSIWAGLAARARIGIGPEGTPELNPYLFHLANVAFHALAALAAYAILRRLTASPWASAAGALIFAIHPLKVEPVAWVTGLKDVLSGALALGAIWMALRWDQARQLRRPAAARWRFLGATLLFLLAMFAKPSVVILPFVAAIVILLARRRWELRPLAPLAIWLALATPFVAHTGGGSMVGRAEGVVWSPLWARPLIAADAIAFYIAKMIFPWPLGIAYARSPDVAWRAGFLAWTWIAPVALIALAWAMRRRWPQLAAGAAIFFICLAPASGLAPFEYQRISTVADRYAYLALLAPAIIVAFALRDARRRILAGIVAAALLGVYAGLSMAQGRTWRDSQALWRQSLAINPGGFLAHQHLAAIAFANDDRSAGLAHSRKVIELYPPWRAPDENLALAYEQFGRAGEAEAIYRGLVQRMANPPLAALLNLAGMLAERGDYDEAIPLYQRAVAEAPRQTNAWIGLRLAIRAQDRIKAETQARDEIGKPRGQDSTATAPAATAPAQADDR